MKNILHAKLTAALKPLILEISDDSAQHAGHSGAIPQKSTHFRLKIMSQAFTALSRLERHRLVYKILEEELKQEIHALSLSLLSPLDTL